MQTAKLNERLQLFASLSVLAGLLLVAYEVRQNNVLAQAEAVTAMQNGWEAISISEYETDIAVLRAKSIDEPENLTAPEIYKLNGWLTAVVITLGRRVQFEDRGLGYAQGSGSTGEVDDAFDHYIDNHFARIWYLENRSWMTQGITEIWDRRMNDGPVDPNNDYARRMMERIQKQLTDH
jgi:hypothetical protein